MIGSGSVSYSTGYRYREVRVNDSVNPSLALYCSCRYLRTLDAGNRELAAGAPEADVINSQHPPIVAASPTMRGGACQ
jgi:hypothetical protein